VALRRRTDEVPALLRDLIPATRRAAADSAAGTSSADTLRQRLAGFSPAERYTTVLDLVRGRIAAVLGHADPAEIAGDRPFKELGFDSLSAVEFRNALAALTGVRLPATLAFDYPSPGELTRHLLTELAPEPQQGPGALLAELTRLEADLARAGDQADWEVGDDVFDQVAGRLEGLRSAWQRMRGPTGDAAEFDFGTASDDEVFEQLDKQLGLS
jgi:acyl carrier protein